MCACVGGGGGLLGRADDNALHLFPPPRSHNSCSLSLSRHDNNINSRDVRGLTQASVRALVGVVPQDTCLFNDTLVRIHDTRDCSLGRVAAPFFGSLGHLALWA